MVNLRNLISAIVFASLSTEAFAQDPAPESLGIGEVTYQGSGCPQGSVGTYVSEDRLAMTLMFDNYAVEMTSANSSKIQKSCNITLKLLAPAGWSVGVIGADFRGYGSLDSGVLGEQTSVYRFGANRWSEVGLMRMAGPTSNDYVNSTNVDPHSVEWSPCIRNDRQAQIAILTQISLAKFVSASIDYKKVSQETHQLSNAIRVARQHAGSQLPANHPMQNLLRSLEASADELNSKAKAKATQAALNDTLTRLNATWKQLSTLAIAKKNRRGVSAMVSIKKFELSLSNSMVLINPATADARGLLTMDTADAEVKHEYGLMWKRCDPNGNGRGNGNGNGNNVRRGNPHFR